MWLLACYLLIFGTIIPYLLISASMRHLPPTSVGIIGMTELFLAALFAWLLLSEVLTVPQVVGGLVLLAGVVLAETARAQTGRAEKTEPAIPPV
jgi:drug/metabolite transporter (DMT)-like permease